MNKNRTKIILATSILSMLVSFSILILFYHIIENKNKHTDAVLGTLADKMAEKANSAELEAKSAEIAETDQKVNKYLVDSSTIDDFVNYLEGLGASAGSGVKVENFNSDNVSKNALIVRITTSGTFSQVMRVLELIENSPYKVHIINTGISQNTVTGQVDPKTGKQPAEKEIWQGDISFSVVLSQ